MQIDWQIALGYFSGLAFLDPHMPLQTVIATMAVVNTCDAVMCRLFALANGYPPKLWTLLGLVFGIWAVAALIVLPKRERKPGPRGPVRIVAS